MKIPFSLITMALAIPIITLATAHPVQSWNGTRRSTSLDRPNVGFPGLSGWHKRSHITANAMGTIRRSTNVTEVIDLFVRK